MKLCQPFFDDNILGVRLWNCGHILASLPSIVSGYHLHGATFSKYPLYRIYNMVASYSASTCVINTRYKDILQIILLKFILRIVAKSGLSDSIVRTILKAVKDGLYYGSKLRSMGLNLNLYKAPYVPLSGKGIIMKILAPRTGFKMNEINNLIIGRAVK